MPQAQVDAWDPWVECSPHPCVQAYDDAPDRALACCLTVEGTTAAAEVDASLPPAAGILTARGAVCASQAQGFSRSDDACTADLRFGYTDVHFWDVRSPYAYECDDGVGHFVEERVFVDATTGAWFRRGEQVFELLGCT